MKKILFYMLVVAGSLSMASCQLGQHYTRPELNLPERLSKAPQNDTLTIADMQWWEMYTDTTLQQLISKTLEHNKDLLISSARVKELAAMKRIDWANLFPRIDAKAFIEKEGTNYGGDNYKNSTKQHAKFIASWELDLWGNLRWAKDKSMAQFLGSIEAQRALKMSIISEVAQSYFELVALDNELKIVRQTLKAREEACASPNCVSKAVLLLRHRISRQRWNTPAPLHWCQSWSVRSLLKRTTSLSLQANIRR